jgi:hypothetical protein
VLAWAETRFDSWARLKVRSSSTTVALSVRGLTTLMLGSMNLVGLTSARVADHWGAGESLGADCRIETRDVWSMSSRPRRSLGLSRHPPGTSRSSSASRGNYCRHRTFKRHLPAALNVPSEIGSNRNNGLQELPGVTFLENIPVSTGPSLSPRTPRLPSTTDQFSFISKRSSRRPWKTEISTFTNIF